MAANAERRAARQTVGAYHEEQLAELIDHVKLAVARFEAGELDAFQVDEAIFQYSRAAKELWKFCNLTHVEIAARIISEDRPGGWWERGEPRRR